LDLIHQLVKRHFGKPNRDSGLEQENSSLMNKKENLPKIGRIVENLRVRQ